MMTDYRYRIYDATEQHILANNLTLEQAQKVKQYLQADAPNNTLEIEKYVVTTPKWQLNR